MSQPTSKHHADWLALLEISGPFLSMPVLTAAFPQGLDMLDEGQARSLRADYGFWQENADDPAVHTAWIRLALESLLGYSTELLLTGQAIGAGWKAEFPEHEETLRPDYMLVESQTSQVEGARAPHLLIQVYPPGQDLEKAVRGSRWQASAATRMMELLHATQVRLGLLTNGEQWMLVNAPRGETTGFAAWYAGLWFDEPGTLRAFRSLLGAQRFFGVAQDQTLESLLAASTDDQQEITDQLGLQVRHAVEILIQKIDQADQDSRGALLAGIGGVEAEHVPSILYEAALTVMMRLVFMLSAEERKLLPLDDALYAENYAVSTLYAQLSATEEEVLERRFDAWSRLLAVFRAVHDGIFHERLNLPPYGGGLFDPEKYPFLEGRRAFTAENAESAEIKKNFSADSARSAVKKEIPLPVSNRTVLHLLGALQVLQIDGEARRLSFRALDVEQIGHVYEGLLDHRAARASEAVLGLRGAKRLEPEVALSELEKVAGGKESDFLAWLNACTGRSLSALKNAVARDIVKTEYIPSLRAACGNDEALFGRVARFAGLLRTDDFGLPVVILAGSVYVTAGTTRRATGTHYTPRSLTEPVVQHTLEPLVYDGPAQGLPRAQWRLRSPAELLDLKICDMAMGSGGFLVQVVRYMAERLVEAWELYGSEKDEIGKMKDEAKGKGESAQDETVSSSFICLSPPGDHPSSLSDEDDLIYARRLIAERCLYGVDKNPLAVEIAKLSLWLITMDKGKPFSFLDHALKCGDSLVGCSEDDFLRWAHGYQAAAMTLFDEQLRAQLETARAKRRELEGFVVGDAQDAARKALLLQEAEAAMAHVWRGADLLTGARLLGLKPQEIEDLQVNMLFPYMAGKLDGPSTALRASSAAEFSAGENLPKPGKNNFPTGRDNFPPGRSNFPSGSDDIPPGRNNFPAGSEEFPSGRNNFPGGSGNFPTGSEAFPAGAARALAAAQKERAFHWEFAFPEVFARGGFSAFVGNPPFVGGRRIRETVGDYYRDALYNLYESSSGNADYCAFFFLASFNRLKNDGSIGLIATNTISQGDTRQTGLDKIVSKGGVIYRAINSQYWPGAAAVVVSIVHIRKGEFLSTPYLNEKPTDYISALLESGQVIGNPYQLVKNSGKSFQGSLTRGMGFVISPTEAQSLLNINPKYADVVHPFLNGDEINSNFDQAAHRWVINFYDWPIEKSKQYEEPFRILYERVYPERMGSPENQEIYKKMWWQFWRPRIELYRKIETLNRVLVIALTSKTAAFVFMPINNVFSHAVGVFAFDDYSHFSILQSTLHIQWAWAHGSSLKGDLRYTPSDIFETFPFPQDLTGLEQIGERYHETRREMMLARQEGLTKLYNRFHDPAERGADIVRLRELHVEMDVAVAGAYGWDDLVLGHDFHETAQGVRFTISESARREVLSRLLKLNHERYEEEQKNGTENPKKKSLKSERRSHSSADDQLELF
jgi:hypothetical protein